MDVGRNVLLTRTHLVAKLRSIALGSHLQVKTMGKSFVVAIRLVV